MTTSLQQQLDLYNLWLKNDPDGKRFVDGERDLLSMDLHGANLHGANLFGANLQGANLTDANLTGANLSHTILPTEHNTPHDYQICYSNHNRFTIHCGCRHFTYDKCRNHWLSDDYPDRQRGIAIMELVDIIKRQFDNGELLID